MLRILLYLIALAQVQLALSPAVLGQVSQSLYLGAGKPGTKSFELGVGVTSLIKVRLLPHEGVDLSLVETADRNVVGDLLITDQETLATLTGWEPITKSQKSDLRSIMSFVPSDREDGRPLELVARADVPDKAVYLLTKSILENAVFLEDLNQQSWDLSADQALAGLNLPLHPGAIRYYEEIGEANLSVRGFDAGGSGTDNKINTSYSDNIFFLDFASDTTALDRAAKQKIAEACQYAAVFDAPEIRVASHRQAGVKGTSDQKGNLVDERISYVLSALRSNAGCADSLDIVATEKPASSSSVRANRIELIVTLP